MPASNLLLHKLKFIEGGILMERIKNLGRYQKAILILMSIMVLGFAVLYGVTVSREGFAYQNAILVPNEENGNTTYSGKIQGNQAVFTVTASKTVTFQYGDKVYGPYTAKKDPTAVPKDSNMANVLTGVELRCGKEVVFRGGVWKGTDHWLLVDENDSFAGDGSIISENANAVDPMEPSASTVLELMGGPELEHKGQWIGWFGGVLLCAMTAVSILFADELFYLSMAFKVRDAESAEPSDWVLASRYIAWTVMPAVALLLCIVGLQ